VFGIIDLGGRILLRMGMRRWIFDQAGRRRWLLDAGYGSVITRCIICKTSWESSVRCGTNQSIYIYC
jgi:hypothetical protein